MAIVTRSLVLTARSLGNFKRSCPLLTLYKANGIISLLQNSANKLYRLSRLRNIRVSYIIHFRLSARYLTRHTSGLSAFALATLTATILYKLILTVLKWFAAIISCYSNTLYPIPEIKSSIYKKL